MSAQERLMRLRHDAVSTVERFRRSGWKVGLLTDSTCETEAIWPRLELARLFHAAAFSCTEGRSKPDPCFYEVLTRRLGVAPHDCLYVADGRSGELAGAARLGMRPVQLRVCDGPPGAEDWPGESAPGLGAVADLVLPSC